MPFTTPWTDHPADRLPTEVFRHIIGNTATVTPENWALPFVVRVGGQVVGLQDIAAKHFPVTRTAETGSWLGQRHQGRGIGTRMRRMVCTFGFEGLGARRLESRAFFDNAASLRVSRALGYDEDGTRIAPRRGGVDRVQSLTVTPETFVAGPPPTMLGAAAVREFLEIPAEDR